MDVEEFHKLGDADRNPSAVISVNQTQSHSAHVWQRDKSMRSPILLLRRCIVFDRKVDGGLPLNPVTLPAVYDLPLTMT